MRTAILITFVFLAIRSEASTLSLTNWARQYPDQRFFNATEVKKPLKKILTPDQWKRLTETYSTVVPIQLMSDYLVVKCFMPHDTPAESAMVVIDLKRGRFHVGFYHGYYQQKTTIEWISSEGEFFDLPKEIQDEFYYQHNVKP
jgi:hypothetical protein